MAYKVGTCTGHYELLEIIRRFAKGNGILGQSSYSGTGDGTMSLEDLSPDGSNEVWTVSCIDNQVTGEELWSVTGSVSGQISNSYTTGQVFAETKVGFQITAGATPFDIADAFTIVGSSFSGTGNGTIDTIDLSPAAVTETWTVACTDATTPGSEVWSVTGSVSGAQASATTGVAYSNTYITDFTITAGGTNFAVSDSFTFEARISDLSNANQAWVEERYIDNVLDGEGLQDLELILRGPGLSGTEEVWASITTDQSALSDYYNMVFHTHIGYVSGNSLSAQPGYIGDRTVPMWNLGMTYWLAINGQRIALACKVETHYNSAYVGKFFSYSTPNQYPYPITVGAMTTTTTLRYSSSYSFPYDDAMAVRKVNGSWSTFKVWPYENPVSQSQNYAGGAIGISVYPAKDCGGEYPLIPTVVFDTSTKEMYGELDGIYYVPGFNSAVENTILVGGTTYIKIADNQGTGFNDYYALRLD